MNKKIETKRLCIRPLTQKDSEDVFSWLPEKQISLGQLEEIFRDYVSGIHNDKYSVQFGTPNNASDNILMSISELTEEGKEVVQ